MKTKVVLPFIALVLFLAPLFAYGAINPRENILDPSEHPLALVAGLIFAFAYALVIAEEAIHMRKSKAVTLAAGIIWVLIGIGAAGHQAWSANIYTLVSDVFPKKATASIIGLGGMVGAVAGIISSKLLGRFLDQADNTAYFWAFLIAGSSYLIVLGAVHLLMPKMVPYDENLERTQSS